MNRPQVFADPDAIAAAVTGIVSEVVRGSTSTRLVLAGGTTPKRCYLRLAEEDLPWGRVTILFGDERCVPPWDAESNFRMASETLLDRVRPATVARIPAELGPEPAAAAYEAVVAAAPLDLVLLGVGPDGHTASLFPGNRALKASSYAVGVHNAPKPPPDRVSLTFRALREARRVLILAAGADKAEAFRQAQTRSVPAGMVDQAEWFVTRDVVEPK